MSLGKLLTAGKSLVGLHDSNSRYRLQKGALPKFESSKNPFAARPAAGEPAMEPGGELALPNMAPEPPAVKMKRTQALPILAAEPKAPMQPARPVQDETPVEAKPVEAVKAAEPVKAPEAIKPPEVVDGWVKKLNPLVWFSGRKPVEPKPGVPRSSGKRHVQGELSLDNIKVMRNDLSDTDVEVVPAKARAPKTPPSAAIQVSGSAAAMAVPELPPARTAWEYLGERLLGKH